MQLDQNRIAIRERSFLDVLDLALRVIRAYAKPLLLAFTVGVVPAACFNAWILADYTEPDFRWEFPATYMWYMLVLILWEIPLVTAPMTKYLGQALFTERPAADEIGRELLGALPQMLWYQVLCRSVSLAVLVSWGLLLVSIPAWIVMFVVWPFLNEIILLERNPMFRGRRKKMTTRRRMRMLHGHYQGELFSRWTMTLVVGVGLSGSVWLSCLIVRGLLVYDWEYASMAFTVVYPLAVWLVVGYLTVVRFLSYLDLRIRREGWEVELIMRAEQARLARQLT